MSLNGGYKIIDFKDRNLTNGVNVTIDGIYDKIENNHRKAYLLSGLTIENVEKPDVFRDVSVADNTYTFADVYGQNLVVTSSDVVRWGEAQQVPELS